jgi:hypothetical protein
MAADWPTFPAPLPKENNMSDSTAYSDAFSKFVPGFEFLQGLVRNAGQSLPTVGQWVAPTLDPAELDRRIQELRTVQFWLEQNARMIGTTVQALEVQRMTLGALRTMNVPLADLGEALKVRPAAPAPAPAQAPAPAPAPAAASAGEAAPAVDPVQWWGALTQQFTELASQALQAAPAVAAAAAATVEPTPAAPPAARKTSPRQAAPRARKSPSSAG